MSAATKEKKLPISDIKCPICYLIMIEPVVMPCNHGLCMPCFKETVAKNALACPFCKKRISIWLRNATKKKQLVHIELWDWIKENFKEKVERRLNGLDDEEEESQPNISLRLSAPGEIKEEFTTQLKKLEEEERARKEQEEMQSLLLISKIQNEEKELNRSQESLSPKPIVESNPSSHRKVKSKPLKRSRSAFSPLASSTPKQLSLNMFFKSKSLERKSLRDITTVHYSDSDDDSKPQMDECRAHHQSTNLNDKENNNNSVPSTNASATSTHFFSALEDKIPNSSREIKANSTHIEEPESSPLYNSQVYVTALGEDVNEDLLNELIEEQKKLEERLKQEKEDEILAIRLQKEMKEVNRSKGSEDEYKLRGRITNYLSPPSCSKSPSSLKRPREKNKSPASSAWRGEMPPKSPRL